MSLNAFNLARRLSAQNEHDLLRKFFNSVHGLCAEEWIGLSNPEQTKEKELWNMIIIRKDTKGSRVTVFLMNLFVSCLLSPFRGRHDGSH